MRTVLVTLIIVFEFVFYPWFALAQTDCPLKSQGDADCNSKIDIVDFEIWRKEASGLITSTNANFNFTVDSAVNIIDFEIWRKGFFLRNNPTPSSGLSPTKGATLTPSPISQSCLTQQGPLITKTGSQSRYDIRSSPLAKDSKVDARLANWTALWPVQDSFNYPVLLAGGPNVCFSGGTIQGSYPEQIGSDPYATWTYMHSTTAMAIYIPNFTIENTRINNYGDGISPKAEGQFFTIKGVHLSHIRDDCIENDDLHAGLIDDSLFDGCYEAFSARPECTGCDGRTNIMTIQNSLIRLEAIYGIYKNKGVSPGHDGFFKWDSNSPSLSPKLVLKNNIFRADQQANNVGLGLPRGKVIECSNNTLVWLGPVGSSPQPSSNQDPITTPINGQPCFTISRDKNIWDSTVSVWKSRH